MTSAKAKMLKDSLDREFAQIFDLCYKVLNGSKRPTLIVATLQTLKRFLIWIRLQFIFETPLIRLLVQRFFPAARFRDHTLECLTEIAGLSQEQYSNLAQYNP